MYRPRIIPALLLYRNGFYKTQQFSDPVYVGDPINAVKIFNDLKADELIVLDIESSVSNKPIDYSLLEKISEEAFMPFSFGGGIDSIEKIKKVFDAGSEKVVLNSVCYESLDLIEEAAKIYGSQAVVCSIDVRLEDGEYILYSHSGKKKQEISLKDHLQNCERKGAGEIFLNSIDKDGKMEGYDLELYRQTASYISIPIIACGGAKFEDDLVDVIRDGNASAAAAGSLFVFMGGRNSVMINYPDKEEIEELFR